MAGVSFCSVNNINPTPWLVTELQIQLNCYLWEDAMHPLLVLLHFYPKLFTNKLGYKCVYCFQMSHFMMINPLAREPFPHAWRIVRMTKGFSEAVLSKRHNGLARSLMLKEEQSSQLEREGGLGSEGKKHISSDWAWPCSPRQQLKDPRMPTHKWSLSASYQGPDVHSHTAPTFESYTGTRHKSPPC